MSNEAAERLQLRFQEAIRYGIDVETDYYGNGQDDEEYILKPARAMATNFLPSILAAERKATVERIREIHVKQEGLRRMHPVTQNITDYICSECDRPWPCDTTMALDAEAAR